MQSIYISKISCLTTISSPGICSSGAFKKIIICCLDGEEKTQLKTFSKCYKLVLSFLNKNSVVAVVIANQTCWERCLLFLDELIQLIKVDKLLSLI